MGVRHVVTGGGAHQGTVHELLVAQLRAQGVQPRAISVEGGPRPEAPALGTLRETVADLLEALSVPPQVVTDLVGRALPDDIEVLLEIHDHLRREDTPVVAVPHLPAADLLERPARYARALSAFVPVVARWEVLLGPVGVSALPAPSASTLDALRELAAALTHLDELLGDPRTGIHLVPRPGAAGAAEHAAAVVALALMGRRATSVHESPGRPVDASCVAGRAGEGGLRVVAETPGTGGGDPGPATGGVAPRWRVELDVPGLHADDLDLVRHDDDLVLACAGRRRTLTLPPALRRCVVERAGVRDGVLALSMSPDPEVWWRAD